MWARLRSSRQRCQLGRPRKASIPSSRHSERFGNSRRSSVSVSTEYDTLTELRREFRSEEHTSELQSRVDLVCRLLLEKKKKKKTIATRDEISRDKHEIEQRSSE